MANIRYITSSAEMEMFLYDQQKEMRNAMANIRKATKASIPLHDFWTAKQIFEKPPAIAAHEYNTVNDKIVWDQDTRVPMLPDFTTTSIAYHSDVPMHMVKHSDARMAATLIAQEGHNRALEGSIDQFVPLRRLSSGLVPFVGLQILRALPFKLDLDEEFYDMQARRETQRQTLESVLHNLKANDNSKITAPFIQTVADIFGPRARLGPFLDIEGTNTSTPAIYTTYPTSHNTYLPSNRSMDMIAELGYDKHSEGALLCRLIDDEQSNARWMGVNVLFALPFKVHLHPAIHKAFQDGRLKLPAIILDERSAKSSATSGQNNANLFAHASATEQNKSLGEIGEAGGSSTTTSYNPMPTEPMSKQTEEAKAVEHQDSTQESPRNQTSPQAERPGMVSSDAEHPEDQSIAGEDDDEAKETASQGPTPTQAAASTQPANTTTSKCMLLNCQRPMTRAEVRRTHLVTHYAKWHGMPAVQRVYGGNWSASNDAQDAIIVPWLRSLGVDPASIKLNGEVVFKG
ncbi:hypothetical protein KC315_g889 [Hortaea werneckii]|nr:hypothetical protein KC315_g889 [Hortaea werneckii]KAI7369132.1 hypothetical protein KC354_g2148 [Hortaea werneckii]KAI7722320.1 hypothetical protein KC353_g607 [Hortaea werneckii]